jgi:hypothetical protein
MRHAFLAILLVHVSVLLVPSHLMSAADGAAVVPSPASVPSERSILFGADYGADRPIATRTLFFEAGLNCVRLTGGGYGWAAAGHLAYAQELAKHGVSVYLQLGSHYPSADYFHLKDAWLVDQNGKTGVEDRQSWSIRYDGSSWPQYSYAHAGIREQFAKDFTAYLGNFPPSPTIAGVILHNEPGMHWLKDRVFDYSAVSIAAFRAWLPSQHATIADLNRRWGTAYVAFTDVVPPVTASAAVLAAWMDWRRFQVVQIADFLHWEAGFVKGIRPDLARTTNLDGPTNNWYATRCADVEAYSRSMDTVGMDIYPTPWTDREFVPYAVDQLLGVAQGRRAHVLECEVFSAKADDWKQLSDGQRADLLRSELWTMYGHGVDGILMWGFSRGDTFSVTDGEYNQRIEVCRDVSHLIRMIGLGRFTRTAPQVAICLDPDAYIRAGALDGGTLSGGSALDQEFHGMHAALAAVGVPCDVVMAAQLSSITSRYRVIILPACPLMDDATAARLKAFVQEGGTLIAVGPFAAADRWGASVPTVPGFGFNEGASATGAEHRAAGDGVPATTVTSLGQGHLLLISAPMFGAYLAGQAPGLPPLLAGILARARIAPSLHIVNAGAARPDTSLLVHGSNRLLVIAAQGDRTTATLAATRVVVEVPGAMPKAVFAFPPTRVDHGMARSGPIAVTPTATTGGCSLELGTITSALPVLLCDASSPLIALEMPATIAAGAATTLTVTCYNPSSMALSGTIDLQASGLSGSTAVTIPAWGTATASLAVTIPAATPRLAIGAVLHVGAGETVALPIDVTAK